MLCNKYDAEYFSVFSDKLKHNGIAPSKKYLISARKKYHCGIRNYLLAEIKKEAKKNTIEDKKEETKAENQQVKFLESGIIAGSILQPWKKWNFPDRIWFDNESWKRITDWIWNRIWFTHVTK